MKYLVLILVALTVISLFQYAQARDIGPFMFGLAEKGDWMEHSDSSATDYYGILKQGATINLPLKIIAGSVPTPLEFHATIGEQMGQVKLPKGIKVEIEPESFLMESEKDVILNIFITAEKNAPSNVYSIGIVGVWPEPVNNFAGTSVKVHVGRDFGPSAIPDNFFPPPLKQVREGSLPSEVVCTNDFVLVLKNNGSPACVKQSTFEKLYLRGWGDCGWNCSHEIPIKLIESNIPSDFSMAYSFGIDGKSVYDSKKNLLLADRVCEPPIELKIELSSHEKEVIWNLIEKNDFFSFTSFTQNCDESGLCLQVTPEAITTLSVTANGKEHSVQHRDSYRYKDNPSYLKFEEIIQVINDIFRTKDDYKNLPSLKCAYQ